MITIETMPKYLDNSPLYSVILEIRFTSQVPDEAVPGLLYSKLLADGVSIQSESLPVSQLPLALRQQDPNLKFAPTQQFSLLDQTINIGSNVLSLEANNGLKEKSYPGWDAFSSQFEALLGKLNFISEIERIGLRYVNFFQEEDLLSELNVELTTGWESRGAEAGSTIIFSVQEEQMKSKVTIACDATIEDKSGKREGQVIDVDTYIDVPTPIEDVLARVHAAHALTKKIFYSLPKQSLMDKMSPHE